MLSNLQRLGKRDCCFREQMIPRNVKFLHRIADTCITVIPTSGFRFTVLIYGPTYPHTHAHRDKVIALSPQPYVVEADPD